MNRARAIFLLGLLAAAGGWLCHTCAVNPNVSFLAPGPGSWIVYPAPPSVPMLDRMPMTAVFRRVFVLPGNPASATVSWRCFKQGQLILNGQKAATTLPAHWKNTARLEAAGFLHPGTNEMEARVTCDNGLPALSLELEAEGFALKSDEAWQCSLEGAVWQPAWPASRPLEPAPGNGIYGAEEIGGALRECWPLLSLFAIVAALAAAANGRWGRLLSGRGQVAGVVLLTVAWALLLLHNFPLLPAMIGFDAPAHLAYMEFIQDHAALPSASQGSEFFQAPLYYVLGAGVLGLFHLRAMQPEAGQVLGLLNLLLGVIELALILAGLRLLFPGRRRLQLAGLLLAALLPARVYLFHYPTNETLGAVMTTAALCLYLRILRQENPGLGWYAGLGVALGAALLSKASAVIALGAVILALAAKAWCERQCLSAFLRRAGLCLGLCLLMSGWHYWNLWREFGSPFAGDCDPAVGASWWQLPGYRTMDYYLAFGQSLGRPFFSGFRGFWDGLYSTWWGDGLMGGESILYGRPPWNYNLMTAGFVLALMPSALVLTGLWRALNEGLRRRRWDWLLLAVVPLLYGLAIFWVTLKLAFYSQSRAMYGLPAILPFCALGALGLDFWVARCRRARPFLLVWLGVWLLTVYASFWIRPDSVQTRLAAAVGLYKAPGQDPGPAFAKVLELDPRNAEAIVALAGLDKSAGHLSRAVARLEAAARTATNAMINTALALRLGEQGRVAEAVEWAGRACELTVDYPVAPALLCSLSLQAGRNELAARAGFLALRLKPQDGEVHFNTGVALERLNRHEEAVAQFADAVECSPQNAGWKSKLAEMQKGIMDEHELPPPP
jgi:tetratricopeptide (TPR) repeat protein